MISFKKDKTVADFVDRFYLEAQILTGSGSLTVHNAHIALRAAVKPYEALYQTLMPAFQDNCILDSMVHYFFQCSDTFGPPNTGPKPRPVSNYPGRSEAPTNNNKSMLKPDITKVVCPAATGRATTPLVATPRQGFMHYTLRIQSTGKSQCGVEEELSTSTQSTNVPPDLLFMPDTGFLGNALHQVLVDNVHMVQTRSKVQASQETTKEVSKPYACQLLDDTPDIEPQRSGDATPLRGVNVAILMDTMKDHLPKMCDSIVKFLSTANNLDIHLVNNIGYSYSECTYADIFVNKLKVQDIINTGAPINIVSSKLVQCMSLAPDIDHKKQYGTAGLDCTTT
ncbi:hypothetical protein DSO57_1031622 [Entomophthora muscae]|uniref:Uncharacterized protein n=1 Tax=Entomophthora muscae TaxID=34485 RepID=A0ACC2TBE0_9FUNG|nr:hypothetical protein DSO57_1031622 [Entomophthora muscae]